jgi:hypothetical protein
LKNALKATPLKNITITSQKIPQQDTHVAVVELIRYISNNKTTNNASDSVAPTLFTARSEQEAILNPSSQSNVRPCLNL